MKVKMKAEYGIEINTGQDGAIELNIVVGCGIEKTYAGPSKLARNVSFRNSLRWLIHIINSVDKTKLVVTVGTLE